jgi:hypothetical protein
MKKWILLGLIALASAGAAAMSGCIWWGPRGGGWHGGGGGWHGGGGGGWHGR